MILDSSAIRLIAGTRLMRRFFPGDVLLFPPFVNLITSTDFHFFRKYPSLSNSLAMLVSTTIASLLSRFSILLDILLKSRTSITLNLRIPVMFAPYVFSSSIFSRLVHHRHARRGVRLLCTVSLGCLEAHHLSPSWETLSLSNSAVEK